MQICFCVILYQFNQLLITTLEHCTMLLKLTHNKMNLEKKRKTICNVPFVSFWHLLMANGSVKKSNFIHKEFSYNTNRQHVSSLNITQEENAISQKYNLNMFIKYFGNNETDTQSQKCNTFDILILKCFHCYSKFAFITCRHKVYSIHERHN